MLDDDLPSVELTALLFGGEDEPNDVMRALVVAMFPLEVSQCILWSLVITTGLFDPTTGDDDDDEIGLNCDTWLSGWPWWFNWNDSSISSLDVTDGIKSIRQQIGSLQGHLRVSLFNKFLYITKNNTGLRKEWAKARWIVIS